MEIYDEYSGQLYVVPPEEEVVVLQLQARGATVPEIVDALMLPAPEPEEEKAHGYLPAADGFVISTEEVPDLNAT
jgi:hypothetical protein